MTHHISTRLKPEVYKSLSHVSKISGFTKSCILQKALEDWVEDFLDVEEAMKVLKSPTKTISLEEYKATRNIK